MEAKKISFGFSKINKKPNLVPAGSSGKQRNDEEKIELISCLEGQSIKIVGKENGDEPPPLVIPLREQDKTTIPDRLAKLQNIIEGNETEEVAAEKGEEAPEGPVEGETLEQRAAREIIQDLKERKSRGNDKNTMVVPLKPEDLPLEGGRESTLDDYESVPIEKFGLAMLRGMGWKEDPNAPKKDDKLPEGPIQRPKGMGLGAERVPKDKNRQLIPPAKDEVLTMKKGAFVKVLAGKHKESYGTVESLDEDNARVVVRFSISGSHESLNEYLLQLVSNAEYKIYSKVLNNAKYEEFKNRSTSSTIVKDEKSEIRKIVKREPSSSPPPPRSTSSSKSQPSRSNRDYGEQQRDRRDRSPDRHHRRDREDRREDHRPRERRSRSRDDRRHDRRRDVSSSDDDDSDSYESEDRDRGRHRTPEHRHHKTSSSSSSYARTSSGTKKKSHKYKQRRDHSRDRAHSSDEDDRHHKKKTKKSKKQRSRSRSRR